MILINQIMKQYKRISRFNAADVYATLMNFVKSQPRYSEQELLRL